MSTDTIAHRHDWDAQRERLSAYLDDELPEAERAALAAHLVDCARCAAELAELRQMVTLVGALPAPRLPRSFTLSAARVPVQGPAHRASAPRWAAAAQWAGGLAAAAGFVLLLGGTLATGSLHTASRAAMQTSGAAQSVPQHTPANDGQRYAADATASANATRDTAAVPSGATATAGAYSPTASPAASANASATPIPAVTTLGRASGELPAFDLPGLPIAGATLLVSGTAAFALGLRTRRRRT
jgi:hypothetical protein